MTQPGEPSYPPPPPPGQGGSSNQPYQPLPRPPYLPDDPQYQPHAQPYGAPPDPARAWQQHYADQQHYPAQWHAGQQPGAQPQYGPQPYGAPSGPSPYGWGAGQEPFGARPPQLSQPPMGWALLGLGVLTALAAALPWATVGVISVAGTSGDGAITLLLGLVIAAMGLVIGLRNGRAWTSIVAIVLGALVLLVAGIDTAHISTFSSRFDGIDLHVSVGPGLWLTLAAGVATVICAVIALVNRAPEGGQRR